MMTGSKGVDGEVDKKQVCHYIGCDGEEKLSARVTSLIDDYAENVHQLIDPYYSYIIRNIEHVCGPISIIEGAIIIESEVIARLLEQCHVVAVFAATIGEHLEETVRRLAEDKLVLQAAVLDAIGSDATERLADFVQGQVDEIASAHGLVASQRFSPGYCDWDVAQQKALFQAMKGHTARIRLTDGYLMIPRKSVSGIIGIGPSNNNLRHYQPCKTCDKEDCQGRREA